VDEIVTVGGRSQAPHVDEILELLRDSEPNIVVISSESARPGGRHHGETRTSI
jgi:hypothetical protein